MRSRSRLPELRYSFALLGLCALAGCSSAPPAVHNKIARSQVDPRYGVAPSPRVVADGEEVPRGGGYYMVGKPYQIAGKTYYPSERAYTATGLASWYGSDFHGRKTANGEVFDSASISAAHPTMPLPSYARVTNLRNHRSMIVRVNDRGPYHGGRVMDVSQRVAEALDFHRVGTARVKVDFVGRAALEGSDDLKLLATLRDDGRPATLPGGAPIMMATNLRETPSRVARLERSEETQQAERAAARAEAREEESASRAETQSMARAEAHEERTTSRAEAREAESPRRTEARAVEKEPVSTIPTPISAKAQAMAKSAPLPPSRPFDLGTASPRNLRLRQALN
ncbi:septal ring lytic transglycosylase RlpA family protein [Methylosinus sp. LW4]|uniref:septal ring lytic transglycosylase RlpA family protein n=1 Tax=Methylosinus sp. LW4 TaxID=136993 RepID=UPI00035F3738|nr:septal ring lytic transglycosylase RlpA family protein [Methylosinus sp. LW4]